MRRTLRADQSGVALIYATVMLPVVIGFALLAVDVGRFTTLNSSLQHGADALALAGAAELDGRPDAISRAEGAMAQFITDNSALFTSSATAVDLDALKKPICFMSRLPDSDATPITESNCLKWASEQDKKAAAELARFVQVIVNPKNYNTIFPASFVGALSNTVSTQAEAVAGFQAAVCNFTPLFMCNPFEPTSGPTSTFADHGLANHVSKVEERRKAIRFLAVATGNTATGVPGQYGFLDPATGNGKKALGDEIASVSPELCFIRNKIDTKTGSMSDLRSAFNTRFDLYFGSYKKDDYPPAQNVRKGHIIEKNRKAGDACKDSKLNTGTTGPVAMPVDSCFGSTCAPAALGNGKWGWDPELGRGVTFEEYWERNFPGISRKPSPADLGLGTSTAAYTNDNPPPRYDLYKYENKTTGGVLPLSQWSKPVTLSGTDFKERGTPACNASSAVSDPDRRIVYGAIINCRAEGLRPGNGGYTALAFGKFFIIRPMQTSNDSELWLELVDLVRPGDGTGVARDIVQLYR